MGWFSNIFKGPETPRAPDYTALAEKTSASDAEAARIADFGNRANITGPEGSQTWTPTQVKDPATGQMMTQWSQVNKLNPTAQQTFDLGQGQDLSRMQFGNTLLGGAMDAMGKPLNTSGMQAWNSGPQAGNLNANAYQTRGAGKGIMGGLDMGSLGNMPQADAQERQRIENAMFDRMRPEHQQSNARLEAQLAGMGLTRGSEQWNSEMQRMGDQQSRERFNALEAGGNEMQRLFGMGMQGRQQGFNELVGAGNFQNAAQAQGFGQNLGANAQNFGMQQTAGAQNFGQGMAAAGFQNNLRGNQMQEATNLRQMPLNEYNMLTTGAMPGNLSFQQGPAANVPQGTDYMGAGTAGYNAAIGNYNAAQAGQQGLFSGLTGAAGLGLKAAGMFGFSDARLKSKVVRIGTHPLGVGIYEYDIFGRRERGVMAQELLRVAPQHVYTHASGYLMVDYAGL